MNDIKLRSFMCEVIYSGACSRTGGIFACIYIGTHPSGGGGEQANSPVSKLGRCASHGFSSSQWWWVRVPVTSLRSSF